MFKLQQTAGRRRNAWLADVKRHFQVETLVPQRLGISDSTPDGVIASRLRLLSQGEVAERDADAAKSPPSVLGHVGDPPPAGDRK